VKADEFQVWANARGDQSQRKGKPFGDGRLEKRRLFQRGGHCNEIGDLTSKKIEYWGMKQRKK